MRLPWARAPRAALGSPVTVLVAVVTGLVVSFVAASTVFHVSASGSAAVQYVTGSRCADDTGVVLEQSVRGFFDARAADAMTPLASTAQRAAQQHGLDLVRRSRYGATVPLSSGGRQVDGRLVARDGAQDVVRPSAGGGLDGAWVPSELSDAFGLTVGDTVTLTTASGPLTIPVTAVYPTIVEPVGPYWCSQRSELIKLTAVPEGRIKPPVILVSPAVLDGLVARGLPVQVDRLQVTARELPASREQAQRFADATAAVVADITRSRLLRDEPTTVRISERAAFPALNAELAQHAVRSSLLPLTGISLLVGLAAVVGLAGQWVQRRHAEVRLLWSRGVSPLALGGKAALELGLALLVGAALGWLAARLSVPLLAPARELDPWAARVAGLAAAASWLACVAVLAGATTLRVRRQFQPAGSGSAVRVLRWLPWELPIAALAVVSFRRLSGGALVVSTSDLLPRVDVLALMFPLLCLAVLVGVVSRLSALALRLGHRLRGWRRPALLWAARRAAAQSRLTVALVAITALAVGVVAVGVGISDTERQSVLDKGRQFVGSDTAVGLAASVPRTVELPPALRGRATEIGVRDVQVTGKVARVLVIDPATVADGMPWRPQWAAGASLTDLASRLGPADQNGVVPALLVGDLDPQAFRLEGFRDVRVVGRAQTFPGREHADGILVISWDALAGGDRRGYARFVVGEVSPAELVRELEAAGEPTNWTYTATGANDALPFLVVAWVFDFFVTLGAVLALVAAAALLVSIEARRRATAVAHAMLARMGLRVRALYASHLAELGGLALVAGGCGLLGGWLVLRLASASLDPAPFLSPVPVAASLRPLTTVVVAVAAIAVGLVAAVATRAAVRAPVKELLRG